MQLVRPSTFPVGSLQAGQRIEIARMQQLLAERG